MLTGSSRLLTPDESDATGGAEPTQTATQTDAGTAAPETQPASSTSQTQREGMAEIDQQRLTQLTRKAADSDRTFGRLKEHGYDSFDDAFAALGEYKQLKSDPTTLGVLEALNRPAESETQDVGGEPLTVEAINKLLDERDQRQAQAQFERTYTSSRETESKLIAETLGGERFGDTFKDTSFDDALNGNGTPLQNTLATLLDAELLARGEEIGGQTMPVSDPAVMQEAADSMFEKLKAIRAWVLIDASKGGGGLDKPSAEGAVVDEETERSALDEAEALDAQAQAVFEQTFKQATSQGQPASQTF